MTNALTNQLVKTKSEDKIILLGNRIPRSFFITKGKGESDITIHAGSYHLALKNAGIEMCNIMTYSSIMPGISKEVKKPKKFVHGEVMENIMAVAHCEKGKIATAGIIFGWLHHRKTGKRFGGLVCEYNGEYSLKEIRKKLRASINELYINGFRKEYKLQSIKIITESITPKKQFGTAIASICFTDHIYPIINY